METFGGWPHDMEKEAPLSSGLGGLGNWTIIKGAT